MIWFSESATTPPYTGITVDGLAEKWLNGSEGWLTPYYSEKRCVMTIKLHKLFGVFQVEV